ncbi:MAG: hypothetical protein AAGA30_05875, partial [Planctomycetota bacterium]
KSDFGSGQYSTEHFFGTLPATFNFSGKGDRLTSSMAIRIGHNLQKSDFPFLMRVIGFAVASEATNHFFQCEFGFSATSNAFFTRQIFWFVDANTLVEDFVSEDQQPVEILGYDSKSEQTEFVTFQMEIAEIADQRHCLVTSVRDLEGNILSQEVVSNRDLSEILQGQPTLYIWLNAAMYGFNSVTVDNIEVEFASAGDLVLGDANGDGKVDLLDVDYFVEILIAGHFQFECDVNRDHAVDLLDVQPFVDLLLMR